MSGHVFAWQVLLQFLSFEELIQFISTKLRGLFFLSYCRLSAISKQRYTFLVCRLCEEELAFGACICAWARDLGFRGEASFDLHVLVEFALG